VETRDVATARLEARFPDADVRVETTRVVPHDGFVVVHTTRHVLDEVASSAMQYASVVGDVEIADFANGCTLVVQGVRDDAMRDKTWYNVRVRGSERNVTSVALLTASKLRDAHKPSQS
jgi:hypothetical protein